jgi:hypothetical protein
LPVLIVVPIGDGDGGGGEAGMGATDIAEVAFRFPLTSGCGNRRCMKVRGWA